MTPARLRGVSASDISTAAPIRVVFDTNIVVALLVFADPALRGLSERWARGSVVAIADDETLAELDRVLRYPEMKLDEARALGISRLYRERCVKIQADAPAVPWLPQCRDPDDQKFLLLAHHGAASWVLTRDKALLAIRKGLPFAVTLPEALPYS